MLGTLDLSKYIFLRSCLKDKLRKSIWDRTDELYFKKPHGESKYCHLDRSELFQHLCECIYYNSTLINNNPPFFDENTFFQIYLFEFRYTNPWYYDLHVNSISNECNMEIWNTWKSLCEECPYIVAFENTCIIIERPIELYLDRQLLTHAEGKAAIKFIDGHQIYCNHGIIISDKYGKIHPNDWQSSWILSEQKIEFNEDIACVLICNIGYKKFREEVPDREHQYWLNYHALIFNSISKIADWLFFYHDDFYHYLNPDVSEQLVTKKTFEFECFFNSFPFKLSQELQSLCLGYDGSYQIAPGLYFYPIEQAIQNYTFECQSYFIRLFHGDRQEIYYVLCDNEERMISPVYCQFPGKEPVIYAECVTSLIVTIAQCYQEGAYYIAIDEETGKRSIEQDLDKIEPIFEKFNPDQIDTWRSLWKS
ncbi:hypothetical protein [Chamaesiphon polymorphus]|nr:hypothetical protein [Chamaesiphon polymorphus]